MKYNLLFVDDDKWITDSMKGILKWEDFSLNPPFLAYSVQEAQEIIEKHSIHILISDIEMLDKDGFELVDWVQEKHPQILRIFLTNHARFDYAQRAIRAGIFEYLLKPVNAHALAELLNKCRAQLQDTEVEEERRAELSPMIQKAADYIEANLTSSLSREQIAKELFVSESNLSRSFTKEMGMTLVDYINQCRLDKAKTLLRTTDLPVTQICSQIGYNYTAYFTKIFKDKEGITPKQYREQGK